MAFTAQTFSPTSGTDGRMRNATTQKILAGFSKWERGGKAAMIPIPHFETGSDVLTGTVQADVLKGLGDNQFSVEGIYNFNAVDATETGTTGVTVGASITADFIDSKTVPSGYQNVLCWVSDFKHGTTINNQAASFSATLTVRGVCPTWGVIV